MAGGQWTFSKAFPFPVSPKPKPRAEMNSSESRDGKDSQSVAASLKPGRDSWSREEMLRTATKRGAVTRVERRSHKATWSRVDIRKKCADHARCVSAQLSLTTEACLHVDLELRASLMCEQCVCAF